MKVIPEYHSEGSACLAGEMHRLPAGADTGFMKGGALYIKRCRRQCIEARSADQSARSAENFFRLHFSLLRMGSRGTFALCTASSRCTRIAGPRAAMSR